ncbi:hypothetical protein SeLEV6574_g02470 [Synchytrium endobioticum]|nr:hypothetical protein SeLEV6574_g02470 [Synchytrium endobioticum]
MYKRLIAKAYVQNQRAIRADEDALLASSDKGYTHKIAVARQVFDKWSTLNPKMYRAVALESTPAWPVMPAYAVQAAKAVKERAASKKY